MSCPINSFATNVAFYIEAQIGAVPVDAAAWLAAEAIDDAWRMFVEELGPEFLTGDVAVENVDMGLTVGHHLRPHKGLPTADGGSMVSRMWGTEQGWVTGSPVLPTPLGWMLGHALGGTSTGNHATIALVNSQTSFDVDDADDLVVGQIIGLEDADDLGKVYPARITAIVGVTVDVDRLMPFTVAIGDRIVGAETAYFDADQIPSSTCSILIGKNTDVWVAGGAHMQLDSIAVERGEQPKFQWTINAANSYPPGTPGAVTLPAFVDPIVGLTDVQAIGRGTKARLVTYGSTAVGEYSLFGAAINVGVPIMANDTVTERFSGAPGRQCYRTEPAETTLVLTVKLDAAEQAKWTNGDYLAVTYYQVSAPGYCWCVDGIRGFLMGPPVAMTEDTNKYELTIRLSDDVTKTTPLARAKIVIARY